MNKRIIIKRVILAAIIMFFGATLCLITFDRASVNLRYGIYEEQIEIPIFVYHNIVNNSFEEQSSDCVQTTVENFEKQVLALKKAGYDFITYEDLEKYKNNQMKLKKLSCIVSFDGDYEGIYENAFPIIKKYNVPITICVTTDNIGNIGTFTWTQAKEMQNTGLVTIASHSTNNIEFTSLSTEEAVDNVKKSYSIIEENLGAQNYRILSYPHGLYTDEQSDVLGEQGYIQNLTDNKINRSSNLDLSHLHRCYVLNDSPAKMYAKIIYRSVRYN